VTQIRSILTNQSLRLSNARTIFRWYLCCSTHCMKSLLWTLCAVAWAAVCVGAQALPDFSGTWTRDLSRSEAAAQGTPIGPVTVTIRQTSEEVRVDTTRNGTTQTVRYLPVGTRAAGAGESAGTFRWEGSRLITNLVTHINNQAVTFEEVRSLNSEGTEMAVDVSLVVQHGYQTGGTGVVRSSNSPNSSTGKNVFLKAR
jgi:hypothetical protein